MLRFRGNRVKNLVDEIPMAKGRGGLITRTDLFPREFKGGRGGWVLRSCNSAT